jgi:cytochrome c553
LGAALALGGALVVAGCANPSRSRDLGDPQVSGVTLAQQVCSNCHGLAGTSVSPNFPNLAGQTKAYTMAQLEGFKSHSRQDPAGFEYMWGLSRSLTPQQIEGLADYYAAQVPVPVSTEGHAARIAAGQAIFAAGVPAKGVPACAACHGAEAQGDGAVPRIASQHADYIVKQLEVFQRTDERPEGSVMKTVAHELTRTDIEYVAAYVQALPKT